MVVAEDVLIQEFPDSEQMAEYCIAQGALRRSTDDNGRPTLVVSLRHQFGTDESLSDSQFTPDHLRAWQNDFSGRADERRDEGEWAADRFLQTVGGYLCSSLFLNNRITLANGCATIDYRNDIPSHSLQSLGINREAERKLTAEIIKVFHRALWLQHRGSRMALLVSNKDCVPTAEDRLDQKAMLEYHDLEEEGDGLRSYVAVCMTLLLGQRPLILVDEPELCLHPPQARAIGQFIGENAPTRNRSTVVATHSSDVLRGILDSRCAVTVIRLTNNKGRFRATVASPNDFREATNKPRVRAEEALDGLMADAVVLCEADGDRLVYESTYSTLDSNPIDLRFIPTGGTGGFADPLRLYRKLGTPVAVVGDIDMLLKKEIMTVLVGLAEAEDNKLTQFREESISITTELMEQDERALASVDVGERLLGLSRLWEDTEDRDRVVGGLRTLRREMVSGLRDFKRRGLDGLPEGELRTRVAKTLDDLASVGLFLVPVGQLESWIGHLMQDRVSRQDKSRWARVAAPIIIESPDSPESGDVWAFVGQIRDYLLRERHRLAS